MHLHVTNGDILAQRLSGLRFPGIILPWKEILHEGPVPQYSSFTEAGRRDFNAVRAAYIIQQGWGEPEDVVFSMDQRDKLILDRGWDEVTLWFERDLYDQLSLAQILTLMRGGGSFREGGVMHAFSETHLTALTDAELKSRFDRRTMIDADLCEHYVRFFDAVASGGPEQPDRSAPQALIDAVAMWHTLQPDESGYSGYDRRILEVVKRSGSIGVDALFSELQQQDGDNAFMSDTAFASRLQRLIDRTDQIVRVAGTITWRE